MLRKFYKMQGIGNDYIYFDCMKEPLNNPEELAVRLSDRHFGIGGDGIILLCPSDIADCRMRMFNLDGSEGKMCGNGIRCVGKLAHDLGYVKGDSVKIETLSGVKTLALNKGADGKVRSARVDMGAPVLRGEDIPSTYSGETVVNVPIEVDARLLAQLWCRWATRTAWCLPTPTPWAWSTSARCSSGTPPSPRG